jgi:hypothetical protein
MGTRGYAVAAGAAALRRSRAPGTGRHEVGRANRFLSDGVFRTAGNTCSKWRRCWWLLPARSRCRPSCTPPYWLQARLPRLQERHRLERIFTHDAPPPSSSCSARCARQSASDCRMRSTRSGQVFVRSGDLVSFSPAAARNPPQRLVEERTEAVVAVGVTKAVLPLQEQLRQVIKPRSFLARPRAYLTRRCRPMVGLSNCRSSLPPASRRSERHNSKRPRPGLSSSSCSQPQHGIGWYARSAWALHALHV